MQPRVAKKNFQPRPRGRVAVKHGGNIFADVRQQMRHGVKQSKD